MKAKIVTAIGGALLGGLLVAASAGAASISFNDSILLESTDWSNHLTLDQFDSTLGTLTDVNISLTGLLVGNIKVESFSGTASTITSDLQTTISLNWLGGAQITEVIPLYSDSFTATAFDTILDYDGTSGKTELGVTNTKNITQAYTSSDSEFAQFIGSGTLTFDISAEARITTSGPGGVATDSRTWAAADVIITYTYEETNPVPEPATMLLFGAGIVGLVGAGRKKIFKK